jgi:hypothetical protein
VGFEDKRQGFPKKDLSIALSPLPEVLILSSKKGRTKTFFEMFFDPGSLQPGDYHAKKDRSSNYRANLIIKRH